jgi:two-component system response regulator TctD
VARILVVDDRLSLSYALASYLQTRGHSVTATNVGADALCLLAKKPPPDLIVLDLNMPGMDGEQVLKAMGPTAPAVVVMSGDHEAINRVKSCPEISGKVSRYLEKPFDAVRLQHVIDDVLLSITSGCDDTAVLENHAPVTQDSAPG